eukprot:136958_1
MGLYEKERCMKYMHEIKLERTFLDAPELNNGPIHRPIIRSSIRSVIRPIIRLINIATAIFICFEVYISSYRPLQHITNYVISNIICIRYRRNYFRTRRRKLLICAIIFLGALLYQELYINRFLPGNGINNFVPDIMATKIQEIRELLVAGCLYGNKVFEHNY